MSAPPFVPTDFPRVDAESALAALTGLDFTTLDRTYEVLGLDVTADQRNALDEAMAGLVAVHVGHAMERLQLAERAIVAERAAIPADSGPWQNGARAGLAQAADIIREARS